MPSVSFSYESIRVSKSTIVFFFITYHNFLMPKANSLHLFSNFRLVTEDFKTTTAKMAFIVKEGSLIWMGSQNKVPKEFKISKKTDLKNKLVFPSFIECHTHSVFAGSRADEFEKRNNGLSYSEIAASGGGILSTMKKTREATTGELVKQAQKRVAQVRL